MKQKFEDFKSGAIVELDSPLGPRVRGSVISSTRGVIRILFEGGSVSIKESLFDTMVTKNNIVVIEGEDRDAQNLGSLLSAFSRDDFDPSNFSKLF
jgi:hypothetical protein